MNTQGSGDEKSEQWGKAQTSQGYIYTTSTVLKTFFLNVVHIYYKYCIKNFFFECKTMQG